MTLSCHLDYIDRTHIFADQPLRYDYFITIMICRPGDTDLSLGACLMFSIISFAVVSNAWGYVVGIDFINSAYSR